MATTRSRALARSLLRLASTSRGVTRVARTIVRLHDNDSNADIAVNGEALLLQRAAALASDTDLFVDIGCNVGEWSTRALESGIKGHLVAVDPLQSNLDAAEKRLAATGESNWSVRAVAISDEVGPQSFYVHRDRTLSGLDSMGDMRILGYRHEVDEVEVETTRLEDLVVEFREFSPFFVKIDVEGSELAVLQSGRRLFEQGGLSCCQFEFGHAARSQRVYLHDLVAFFVELDFDIFVIKPTRLEGLNFTPWSENRYSYINLVAIRRRVVDLLPRGYVIRP